MKNLKIKSRTYLFCKSQIKNFGIASFFSKYVIIGSGFAGMTLTNLLLTVCNSDFYELKILETSAHHTRSNHFNRCYPRSYHLSHFKISLLWFAEHY